MKHSKKFLGEEEEELSKKTKNSKNMLNFTKNNQKR